MRGVEILCSADAVLQHEGEFARRVGITSLRRFGKEGSGLSGIGVLAARAVPEGQTPAVEGIPFLFSPCQFFFPATVSFQSVRDFLFSLI